MGEKRTLEQVRDGLRLYADYKSTGGHSGKLLGVADVERMADAIDAHLATPAQTVDVEALREVINEMRHPTKQNFVSEWADKLAQAIGDKT